MQVNYWPSTLDDVETSPESKEAHTVSKDEINGKRVKQVLPALHVTSGEPHKCIWVVFYQALSATSL